MNNLTPSTRTMLISGFTFDEGYFADWIVAFVSSLAAFEACSSRFLFVPIACTQNKQQSRTLSPLS